MSDEVQGNSCCSRAQLTSNACCVIDVEKRDAAKIRRKTLLKVEKIVQCKTQTAEEKLSLLHVHFASVVWPYL